MSLKTRDDGDANGDRRDVQTFGTDRQGWLSQQQHHSDIMKGERNHGYANTISDRT